MTINDDDIPEGEEVFMVSLSLRDMELPVNVAPAEATVRILDNDSKLLV